MFKLIITLCAIVAFHTCYAQSELQPDFDNALKELRGKQYKSAEVVFSKILSRATDNKLRKFCYIYRAFSYEGLNIYNLAIDDLNKAIELDSSDIATYTDRGKLKIFNNDLNDARSDFLFVLAKDSIGKQAEAALYYLGKIAYQQQEYELGIRYYDKYLKIAPGDAEVYFNRGATKDMVMDPEGAIMDYDKAIELIPTYKEAYANRGVAKINMALKKKGIELSKQQTEDACSDLRKAQQLGDDTINDMIFTYCK